MIVILIVISIECLQLSRVVIDHLLWLLKILLVLLKT